MFSPPVGATEVVLMQSVDGTNWTQNPVMLNENSQSAIVVGMPGMLIHYKLKVTGGNHAGESNSIQVQHIF